MKDLSLHLMDIAQNSIAAGANLIGVTLYITGTPPFLECEITDNGKGMSEAFLKQVTDPFTTTRKTREVGLGIPLLKQSAEMAGGGISIQSSVGCGTKVKASFLKDSIDRIPIGDISGTLAMLIGGYPEIAWEFECKSPKDSFSLSTVDIVKVLDTVSIQAPEVLSWIQNTISEGIKEVFGGVLDEVT